MDVSVQKFPERRIVQQGLWRTHEPATEHKRRHPVQAALEHGQVVGLVDMVATKMSPDALQFRNRGAELLRSRRKYHGNYGPRRRATDDGERVRLAVWRQLRQGF